MMDTAVVLRNGLLDLMTSGLPCPLYYHTSENLAALPDTPSAHCHRAGAGSV